MNKWNLVASKPTRAISMLNYKEISEVDFATVYCFRTMIFNFYFVRIIILWKSKKLMNYIIINNLKLHNKNTVPVK